MAPLILRLYRSIFARPRFYKLNYAVFRLGLGGLGIRNWENDNVTGEKYLVTKVLPKRITRADPVIFDVGANLGVMTSLLLEHFPGATIHAFEPHPKNLARLREKLSSPRVVLHDVALGEARGAMSLFDRADSDGSFHASLFEDVITEIHRQGAVSHAVRMETLDDAAAEVGVTYIDFLKIDVEGGELAVLKGASRLLRDKRIGCIQFEFNEMNVISRTFFRDFRKVLPDHELFRMLPKGLLPVNDLPLQSELFGFQNIFAAPREA
jgi:FkbM family methyltransferase